MGKNTGPGSPRTTASDQREDEDEDLRDQEDLHVDAESPEMSGNALLNSSRSKNACLTSSQPDELDHHEDDDRAEERSRDEGDGDAPAATAASAGRAEDPGAAVAAQWRYRRSGAPARARYVLWSPLIVPFAHRRLSALFTQRTSGFPFSKTMPKCSRAPRWGSFPTIVPSSSWTATT